MKRLLILPLLLCALAGCSAKTNIHLNGDAAAPPVVTPPVVPPVVPPPPPPPYLRGVNVMDLGQGTIPGSFGTDYTTPAPGTLQYLSGRGLQLIRLPIAWERMQTTLGGPLNVAYLGHVMQALRDANTAGLKVVLDLHSYGRYNGNPFGAPGAPTSAEFSDLWTRLAAAIEADASAKASLYAYDLMNEPHDFTGIPGSLSGVTMLSDFESGIGSWYSNFTNTGVTVNHVSRGGQGSARLTAPAQGPGAPTTKYGIRLNGGPNSDANGGTIEATIYIPASVPGIVEAFIWMNDSGWAYDQSTPINIARGVPTKIHFTPAAGFLNGSPAYGVAVQVTGGDGATAIQFDVDETRQGTLGGAIPPVKVWENYSQAVVTALRSAGSTVPIMVEGYSWAAADSWPTVHPTPWITDPLNQVIYHAHQYGDDNASGVYTNSYATEQANATSQGYLSVADRYVKRIKHFTDWTATHNVKGFLGEFGWPNSDYVSSADVANWNAVGEAVLDHLDSVEMDATIWTAGSWIDGPGNVMACYDLSGTGPAPLSQAATFEAHIAN